MGEGCAVSKLLGPSADAVPRPPIHTPRPKHPEPPPHLSYFDDIVLGMSHAYASILCHLPVEQGPHTDPHPNIGFVTHGGSKGNGHTFHLCQSSPPHNTTQRQNTNNIIRLYMNINRPAWEGCGPCERRKRRTDPGGELGSWESRALQAAHTRPQRKALAPTNPPCTSKQRPQLVADRHPCVHTVTRAGGVPERTQSAR